MAQDKLNILWTNDNPITSELMVLMYAVNALKRGWWEKVTVILWGAASKLVAENDHIRDLIAEAQEAGVEFSACRACADRLETTDVLENMGIELIFWGEPLTDILKKKENLLTV